ncbi:MAG: TonB-dependent receptor, partial [Xanthomonadaceae bacterium]|nr:TonB-dependent receptor [Xanthomonadaceae bacterium]
MSFKTHKLRDAIIIALAVGVAAPGVALAQNAAESDSKTLDRIEVTGSRIKRAEIEGALPVTVISRDQLESSGDISVADFLRNTSFNTFGSYQSTSGSSGQGFSGISLRGLGTSRTLILIDGRRAPTAPMIGNSQDLNSIPMAAVERIELLSDGASAIYGSDAIGGVVNVITRKDFEGIEAAIGMGMPSEPGGDTKEMSVVMGSAGERSRVIAGASWDSRDVIYTRDRDYWYSSPGASIYSNNFSRTTSTAASALLAHPTYGSAVPGLCTNGDDSDLFYQSANRSCQFNHSATSANLTSLDNRSVFARGDVQINDNWTSYFTASVNRTKSFGRYAPVPSSPWPGGAIRLVAGSPNHPATPAANGGLNPNWADPYYQTFRTQDVFLFHRFAALGPRDGNTENTTSNFMLGFEGLLWDKVDVDFGMRYVQSRAISLGTNYVVGGLAQTAITAGRYNIYNPYAGNPNGLGMTATISRDMETSVKEVYGTAGFDLFSLPGGNAAAVVGAEYREEAYQDIYDPLSSSGQIVGSAGNSAAGSRNVKAVYAEVLFPFFNSFEMSLAGRYDQYSDYGNDFAPKVSFRYHPLDSLTFRASYGQGFRAPSLDILSQAAAFSAVTTSDPATCLMFTGSLSCSNAQVSTYSISNPNLESENSKQ